MNIYIASSWKNKEVVRQLAEYIRSMGHKVYDFTDDTRRIVPGISPDKYPEEFDPDKHKYSEFVDKDEWKQAIIENKKAIGDADLIVLILPCGSDSHADWALGVGMGKRSVVVGQPNKGEQSPVHLWANKRFDTVDNFINWIQDA